ncbi:hypothetical protein LWI29_026317 [Acer saccharum]|uniref:Uncharacterized protein n=1 Tax=Acer saccharum TaxID=4024 RepID=A0AA39RJ16_ACESA|nr:hypothetical protein LWI29_026317 [Acer saccharum]
MCSTKSLKEEYKKNKLVKEAPLMDIFTWKAFSFTNSLFFDLQLVTGVAVGICCMQLVRNITGNPEVRVLKEKRAAGVLDNFVEGERY